MMIKGEAVKVKTFTGGEADPFGSPSKTENIETVENVLVIPGAGSDVESNIRPDGIIVRYTLHFPKTFTGDLTGAQVQIRDSEDWLGVIGSPGRFTNENTPGEWNMPVEVTVLNG